MKQTIIFSALFVSLFTTAFTTKKPAAAKQGITVAAFANDFAFLRAHRQGKGITVTWGMVSNSNLIGFDITKTMQDPTDPYSVWEAVTSIPGANIRSFKHTDNNNVLPGTTYYKVTAWYADGRSSESDVVSVRIVGH
jgi:hypothetical protein